MLLKGFMSTTLLRSGKMETELIFFLRHFVWRPFRRALRSAQAAAEFAAVQLGEAVSWLCAPDIVLFDGQFRLP
jgi:hypothetical protein